MVRDSSLDTRGRFLLLGNLGRLLFVKSGAQHMQGTAINLAGNAVNHPETIGLGPVLISWGGSGEGLSF